MRWFWMSLGCFGALISSLFGMQMDVLTTLSGFQYDNRNPSNVRIYMPLFNETDLILGMGAYLPNHRDGEIGFSGILGVHHTIPLLNAVDIFAVFNKTGGIDSATKGDDLMATRFVVSKKWTYPLTDQIELGVMCRILEVALDGSKSVFLLSSLQPVMRMSISI